MPICCRKGVLAEVADHDVPQRFDSCRSHVAMHITKHFFTVKILW